MTKLTQEERTADYNFRLELVRIRREKKKAKKEAREAGREAQRLASAANG